MEPDTLPYADPRRRASTGAFEDACLAFNSVGASTPIVIWSPKRVQLMHPLIERFADICTERCRDDGMFPASDLNLADFEAISDWLMILRIEPSSKDMVYAYYGSGIAEHFGRDMTGLTTSHFGGHISAFFAAAYREARWRREWLLTDHEPPKAVFVCSWRRLIVPMVNTAGRITGFIAINVPESPLRAGLDLVPEPIFVLDVTCAIRFANSFAKRLFGMTNGAGQSDNFQNLTGVSLKPSGLPDELFARSIVDNRIERLTIGDNLQDDFLITISGAVHSGNPYYIVMLRMLTTRT